MHARDQIIQWFVAQLEAIPGQSYPVFVSRAYDVERDKTPGWLVFWDDETSGYDGHDKPRGKGRELMVVTAAYVMGQGQGAETTLNDMAAECEDIIESDTSAGGLAKDVELLASEAQWTSEGQAHGAVGLRWRVRYRTREGDAANAEP